MAANASTDTHWCEPVYQSRAAELILYGRALGLSHWESEDVLQETFAALADRADPPHDPETLVPHPERSGARDARPVGAAARVLAGPGDGAVQLGWLMSDRLDAPRGKAPESYESGGHAREIEAGFPSMSWEVVRANPLPRLTFASTNTPHFHSSRHSFILFATNGVIH